MLFCFGSEYQRKGDGHHEGVACEDVPARGPLRHAIDGVGVDHRLGGECANSRADTIGHQHKQSLGGTSLLRVRVLLDKERSGDVEEVEGHAIDDHREDKHPHATARIAQGEEAEAQHPGHHGDEHDVLDAVALHKEGDEEDAAGLADLGERDEHIGMVDAEGVGVLGYVFKRGDKGVGEAVGDCRLTPRSIEKQKKMAIFFCLSRAKARSPSASATDFFSPLLTTGQWGSVKV